MLAYALNLQERYENGTPKERRKNKGQVFTPPGIARFMASLFSSIRGEYRLLDPGAGVGVLTAAVCERLLSGRAPCRLCAHLYENDAQLTPLLKRNLENCARVLGQAGHELEYVIHEEDFILTASSALEDQGVLFDDIRSEERFDGAIMNPPYFKLRKDSRYARLMARIVHGQPNVYAFFMALGAKLLREGGELVAITPRSFCNGLYFRGFRRWYFEHVALDHLHLFESRTDAFSHSSVLQESVISKVHRLGAPSRKVTVTTSFGKDLRDGFERAELPTRKIIDDSCGNCVVRVPEGPYDRDIMKLMDSLPERFSDSGLRISTGRVVMFRATQFLLFDPHETDSVPLLLPHNVKRFETVWPLRKNGKPIAFRFCDDSLPLLVPARNYVLLKRFSAKEERRRLTASCLLRGQLPVSHIGLENHLNYVYHADRELTEDEVFGLAALFNSAVVDRYFRTISGNTQVNATEIRSMSFPDLATVGKIGRRVRQNWNDAEAVVLSEVGAGNSIRKQLLVG